MESIRAEAAISRGDLETLFQEYRKSLTEAGGEQVKEMIEAQVNHTARMAGLPSAASFKELMESYDRREYRRALEEEDVEGITKLIRTSYGRRTALLMEEALSETADIPGTARQVASLLVLLVRKLGLFPRLKDYLQQYRSRSRGQKGGPLENRIILAGNRIDQHLTSEIIKALEDLNDNELNSFFESVYEQVEGNNYFAKMLDFAISTSKPVIDKSQPAPAWNMFG